jgi:hypothetical protein
VAVFDLGDLPSAATHFGAVGARVSAANRFQHEAKRVIGTYEYGWPALKLETGEMRDSIEKTIISDEEAEVGSSNMKAVWQELGTSRGIPARSFLRAAAMKKSQQIIDLAKATYVGVFRGSRGAGSEWGAVIDMARDVGHQIRSSARR